MLVLSRKLQEKIQIGPDIVITVLKCKGSSVRLGIEAPSGLQVLRAELLEEGLEASSPSESRKETAVGNSRRASNQCRLSESEGCVSDANQRKKQQPELGQLEHGGTSPPCDPDFELGSPRLPSRRSARMRRTARDIPQSSASTRSDRSLYRVIEAAGVSRPESGRILSAMLNQLPRETDDLLQHPDSTGQPESRRPVRSK